ncbi:MAG: carbohydrate binding domain-containing protein [Anaerolineales bacterium]
MHTIRSIITILAISLGTLLTGRPASAAPENQDPLNLLMNGSFEQGNFSPIEVPDYWTQDSYDPSAVFTWDNTQAYKGSHSVKITSDAPNDAYWLQTIHVQPNTTYLVTGWIKTVGVEHTTQSVDRGANLSIMGSWDWYSQPLFGTNDWTYVSFVFNSGDQTEMTIAARLGYFSGTITGTAWFDNLEVTTLPESDTNPNWKILLLVYDTVDFTYADASGVHHYTGVMTQQEKDQAALMATKFVQEDIPVLDSGNMIPTLTIRYPERPLTELARIGSGWWPSPVNTSPERDPAFDSVIVIWDPWVVDYKTGATTWIGYGAGLTLDMGTGQTYSTIIIDAVWYGHRNVFKHEWGHSITSFYNAYGTAPKPAVDNHINDTTNPYVHCPTGEPYILQDETNSYLIPNSIYNNYSGFTHDYYSGTTATPDQPTRCLGITSQAWASGGPVSKPVRPLTPLQQLKALQDSLDELVSRGYLKESHAKPLYVRLEKAGLSVENEQAGEAIEDLQFFIQKVNGLIKNNRLSTENGQILIDKATSLIDQISD